MPLMVPCLNCKNVASALDSPQVRMQTVSTCMKVVLSQYVDKLCRLRKMKSLVTCDRLPWGGEAVNSF